MSSIDIQRVKNGFVVGLNDDRNYEQVICKNLAQVVKQVKEIFKEKDKQELPQVPF